MTDLNVRLERIGVDFEDIPAIVQEVAAWLESRDRDGDPHECVVAGESLTPCCAWTLAVELGYSEAASTLPDTVNDHSDDKGGTT